MKHLKKYNENSNKDEYIQIIEDIMLDLKDEFGHVEVNIEHWGDKDILLQITSIDAFGTKKEAIEMFKLITKFQSILVESLERIEEAIGAKVQINQSFSFGTDRWKNNTITWPMFFLIKIN